LPRVVLDVCCAWCWTSVAMVRACPSCGCPGALQTERRTGGNTGAALRVGSTGPRRCGQRHAGVRRSRVPSSGG
jgi:hypothetical protein